MKAMSTTMRHVIPRRLHPISDGQTRDVLAVVNRFGRADGVDRADLAKLLRRRLDQFRRFNDCETSQPPASVKNGRHGRSLEGKFLREMEFPGFSGDVVYDVSMPPRIALG